MNRSRKIFYIAFTGLLTSIATTACYWQTNKYFAAKKRWKIIGKQLSTENPKNIKQLTQEQCQNLYAFKYIQLEGEISKQKAIVTRSRGMRTGYLVLTKLKYEDKNKQEKEIIALQGWCPEGFQLNQKQQQSIENKNKNKQTTKTFRGILRKKQTTDYLHKKMKQSDLKKYNMNTWINLQKYLKEFGIKQDNINSNFYFQILKPMTQTIEKGNQNNWQGSDEQQQYPYQYSVDNFQLPYLTPQKHQGYATFWFCTSLVGLGAILKVLKMK